MPLSRRDISLNVKETIQRSFREAWNNKNLENMKSQRSLAQQHASRDEMALARSKSISNSLSGSLDGARASTPEEIKRVGPRKLTHVKYDDGLTEEQWLNAVEHEEDSSEANNTAGSDNQPGTTPVIHRPRKQSLTEDPSKRFVCGLCNRRFRQHEHLKRHYRSLHTADKPFECHECGKKFSSSDNLSQHAQTHGNGSIVTGMLEDEILPANQILGGLQSNSKAQFTPILLPDRPSSARLVNSSGQTLVASACQSGKLAAVKQELREQPEDLNQIDFAGNTPLHAASIAGYKDIVQYLLEAGCSIDPVNTARDTPLHDAIDNSHLDVVKLLLDAGANPRKANGKGEDPYDLVDDDCEVADEIRDAIRAARNRTNKRRSSGDEQMHDSASVDSMTSFPPRSSLEPELQPAEILERELLLLLEESKLETYSDRPKYPRVRDLWEKWNLTNPDREKLKGTFDLENQQKRHEDWMRKGKKLFGKANAPLHILLSTRFT
jgi:hypothetical protein